MRVFPNRLAAADGNDDLEPVSSLDKCGGMLAFRHDLAILLDGQPLSGQAFKRQEGRDGQCAIKLARRAIEDNFDHG